MNIKPSTHDKVAGTAKIIAGSVKIAAGNTVGNPNLQAEGKAEKFEGQVQNKIAAIEKTLGK